MIGCKGEILRMLIWFKTLTA